MMIIYCTNIWTHHQAPICYEFVKVLGEDNFRLCLFEHVNKERKKIGWDDDVPREKWILGPPRANDELEELKKNICAADVAVLGSCPQDIWIARAETKKLTFIMSERMMRNGFFKLRMLNPRFAKGIQLLRFIVNRPNVHYLAIGENSVADAKKINLFNDRIWSWAYFVEKSLIPNKKIKRNNVRILWAGRFLRLKQVHLILHAVAMLKPKSYDLTVELIGDGPMRASLMVLAKRLKIEDCVIFLDPMTHREIRRKMAESDIYIFPSNSKEGWGAVVGEAMSEGCVAIASSKAGASKVLIEHARNGYLFSDRNVKELVDILEYLILNKDVREQVGLNAASDMDELWNPRVGAERLYNLSKGLLGIKPMPNYVDGPCCHNV